MMKKSWGVCAVLLCAALAACKGKHGTVTVDDATQGPTAFELGENAWRDARKQELLVPDGWTSLIGLYWLTLKQHFIGHGADNGMRLDFGPDKLGMIEQADGHVWFTPQEGVALTLNDQPLAGKVELHSDADETPSVIGFDDGKGKLLLLKRGTRFAIRAKHADASSRANFAGLQYWNADESWVVDAKWVPNPPGSTLDIVDIVGDSVAMPNPGYAEFNKDGHVVQLQAFDDGNGLEFVFADRTSGHGSYPAGRFLDVAKPAAGSDALVLDFNHAYNPPCAFTPYATCPLPPAQNRLNDLAVTAGEKVYVPPGKLAQATQ